MQKSTWITDTTLNIRNYYFCSVFYMCFFIWSLISYIIWIMTFRYSNTRRWVGPTKVSIGPNMTQTHPCLFHQCCHATNCMSRRCDFHEEVRERSHEVNLQMIPIQCIYMFITKSRDGIFSSDFQTKYQLWLSTAQKIKTEVELQLLSWYM